MGELVGLSSFKFNSLRKYMAPFYASLQRQIHMADEEKERIVTAAVPVFYERLRTYRDRTLLDICEFSKCSIESLERFEAGEIKATPEIEMAYCKVCYGDSERIQFMHEIRAFYRPSIRETEIALAKDVYIKFGLTSAYVDYQNLNAQRGKILELKR